MTPAPFLRRVRRGDLCAGCGGCALIAPGAIAMAEAAPGVLRPVQTGPVAPEEDAAIARICPGLGQRVEAGTRPDDVLWGPVLEMVEGWARDAELRHAASSGGALSAVLVWLLETGQVDAVVQVAADATDPVANRVTISRSRADVLAAAGSRYAPSAPLAALETILQGGRRHAFVGKPCDVAALRARAGDDARVDAVFPVMLSFFCAGVPALAGARAVLAALGAPAERVARFRYRGHGWPGRATATLDDGGEASMSYHDSWGGILSRHVQHRCKICADGTGKAADLVCADAWHADEKGYPRFEEEAGISLVVARTETGRGLLAGARAAGHLATARFDRRRLEAMQPGQANRRKALLARLWALRLLGRPVPRYRGLHLVAAARRAPPRTLLRNMAGTLRRALSPRS